MGPWFDKQCPQMTCSVLKQSASLPCLYCHPYCLSHCAVCTATPTVSLPCVYCHPYCLTALSVLPPLLSVSRTRVRVGVCVCVWVCVGVCVRGGGVWAWRPWASSILQGLVLSRPTGG